LSPTERAAPPPSQPLADLPLRGEGEPQDFAFPPASEGADSFSGAAIVVAPLSARVVAFAGDLAGTSLAVTLALISAVAVTRTAPRLSGLPWAAAFGLGFSFVFVALPLTLFGRTVGMSLAGLSARTGPSGRRLTPGEATRRWVGTALCAAALGLPLLATLRDASRPTLADRLSGRTLIRDVEG
jgi:hypothetical protein